MTRLNFYRDENAKEWTLLSNRLNSYITSQSFLITAYAIAMGNQNANWGADFTVWFPLTACVLGISTSVRAYPGIDGARKIIQRWREKQRSLFLLDPEKPDTDDNRDAEMEPYNDGRPVRPRKWRQALHNRVEKSLKTTIQSERITGRSVDQIHEDSLKFALLTPWIFFFGWLFLIYLILHLHKIWGVN